MLPFYVPAKIYGVKLKDREKKMRSQSGGAFTAIAEYFLGRGAVIYGCGMDQQLHAVYKRITSVNDLDEIKGSKYVQAELGSTLKQINDDLTANKIVLFSGTPCYAAAVIQFTRRNKNHHNLHTVDFICHGVPSPKVYYKYIEEMQTIGRRKVTSFIFRDKRQMGWTKHIETLMYSDGKIETSENYTRLFYTNLSLRPSCGKCRFASPKRVADFTIGDFWGVQNAYSDFYDPTGVSIIFLNTAYAVEVFQNFSDSLDVIETDLSHVMQPNLQSPSKIPVFRGLFWKDFNKRGVLYCSKKWPQIIEIIKFPVYVKAYIRNFFKT